MKLIIDVFGGDNAPQEILKGVSLAMEELGVEAVLVGDRKKIEACLEREQISLPNPYTIEDAPEVITMEDDPMSVLKAKKESSMARGLRLLADGRGDGFVSAGNTGALTVGATFLVKRIKGVKRPAIAAPMPTAKSPVLLIDCGANVECRPEMLRQFGLMGDAYMKKVFATQNPRVGLANNGTEPTKGTPLQQEAYGLMQEADYQFCGNIEARQIPFGDCDVVVADGFTGNIILKMYEGVAGAMMGSLKEIFMKDMKSKMGALLLKGGLNDFKARMDYKEYGGAVLLGVRGVVVKAHGSSDARSFKNAIRQAVKFSETGVIEEIALRTGG
ncbi:MAG: phosphate acyltransferase PlsX [Clostridiales bacterium]|nr:phosphate acyltransferase PlsX [Clostridiales bacterium]